MVRNQSSLRRTPKKNQNDLRQIEDYRANEANRQVISAITLLFLVLRRAVAFLNCVLLAFVFAMLGPAVPFGTFLMINVRFGINPDLAIAAARRLRRQRSRNGFRGFLRCR